MVFSAFASSVDAKEAVSFPVSPYTASYVQGEVLVQFKTNATASQVQGVLSHAVSHKAVAHGIKRLGLKPDESVEQALTRLRQQPDVLHAQPNYIKRMQVQPNDPFFDKQWGLVNTGQSIQNIGGGGYLRGSNDADIDADLAWDVLQGNASVIVAIIDTGVDMTHPDLAGNIWVNSAETAGNGIDDDGNGYIDDIHGWDTYHGDNNVIDLEGHGSLVAGVVAAVGDNGIGVSGLDWRAFVMVLAASDENGFTTTSSEVEAIEYAVNNGAHIINASFGSYEYDPMEFSAITYANDNGVLFVAAACNEALDNDQFPCYPASYDKRQLPNIISVAATDQFDDLASFSNRGAQNVDVAAPGVNILSTHPLYDTVPVWSEDFALGNYGWSFGGAQNRWAVIGGALYDSPSGNYLLNTDSWAMSPAFILTGRRGCRMTTAFTSINIENFFDVLLFEVSSDLAHWSTAGLVEQSVDTAVGKSYFNADLSGFDGQDLVYFRFRLQTDNINAYDGVVIDGLELSCYDASAQGGYFFSSGTSMAAPFVSGVAALILEQNPGLTIFQLRDQLINSVDKLDSLTGRVASGGRVNAARALAIEVSQSQTGFTDGGGGGGALGVELLMLLMTLINRGALKRIRI